MHMIREKYTLDFFEFYRNSKTKKNQKIFYEFFQADAKHNSNLQHQTNQRQK